MSVNPEAYEAIRQEIISHVVDNSPYGDIAAMCKIAAHELAHRCPGFQINSGHIIDYFGARWNHYWCEAPNGDIVDPTVEQFIAPVLYHNGEVWNPIRLEDIAIIEIPSNPKMLCYGE
jgi:hypothetical protein